LDNMAKNLILWLIIAAVLVTVMNNFSAPEPAQTMSYSQFIEQVKNGDVRQVSIEGLTISGVGTDGRAFTTIRPMIDDPGLIGDLINNRVLVEGKLPERQSFWVQLAISLFPVLIIIAVFMYFTRSMNGGLGGFGGKGGPLSFGRSRARLLSEDQVKTTLADVAGCDEAKEDVGELVEFLRDPGKFQRLGGRIPRGVLMVGPPGTGKTLLAKAIAGEAKVPFFTISGSDFVEMFVGVGASRVRDMFEQAKKHAPCIIFIDEIDAVGRHRGAGVSGGNDEREQTLNQLLVEMDGFEGNDGIIVIAATNRPDVLDSALLRPGRFDRQVVVDLPEVRGREQILKIHMKKVPLGEDVKAAVIARGTPGFSGADLANLVNEAALFAARNNKRMVEMRELEQARDKILMGAERKSAIMSEQEKLNTAYHEAGHAIVGKLMPEADPVYKVTIIPRGRALGVTQFLPEGDRHSRSRRQLIGHICIAFGGRIAEEMTLGKEGVTTGASGDIVSATKTARNMVTQWGLSEKLGPLLYGNEDDGQGFQRPNFSPATAKLIDEEVRNIVDECYATAERLLHENRDKLEAMAEALMKYETIDADQVDDIMAGRPVREPRDWTDNSNNTPPPAASSPTSGDLPQNPIAGPAAG